MEFKKIISIGGMPGLYEMVSNKSDGIVVKSLEDGRTQFVSSRIHGVSPLENISVYLKNDENMELSKVLREMMTKEKEVAIPDSKSDNKMLQDYLRKIVPSFDEEQVHVGDIKKMIKWYHTLKQHDLIPAEDEKAKEDKGEDEKIEEKKEGE